MRRSSATSATLLSLLLLILVLPGFSRQGLATRQWQPLTARSGASEDTDHPLRHYADLRRMAIGAAVDIDALRSDPRYAEVLTREFNSITPENAFKFRDLSPAPGLYDFTAADEIVDFAVSRGMQVRGHTLVWYKGLPGWLTNGQIDSATVAEILLRHVTTVMGRYLGQVEVWDVVNEAIDDTGALRDSVWLQALGPDYIDRIFRLAHAIDPKAQLFYSDYGGERGGPKFEAIYQLVSGMLERGVPINGVGIHMHMRLDRVPDLDTLRAGIQKIKDLGLQVHVTEMDVRIQDIDRPMDERLALQAQVYQDIMSVCLETAACTSFTFWGFTDRYSWIPGATGKEDFPLLFDRDYQPKPAYLAIREAFSG